MQHHPLWKWLENSGVKHVDFAKSVGCSEPHLSLVARGKRGVSLELAHKIESETDHAVTTEQLMAATRRGPER
jgi:DNA-binding transcriptional regulator YdaS (Cro superfamily)